MKANDLTMDYVLARDNRHLGAIPGDYGLPVLGNTFGFVSRPFAVLDELDAPLDEANIGRFVRVLDRFIDKSQFIIVTHSKRTMARADVMYGVTMEEFGVSKPVGMRMTVAEGAKAHAKTETLNLDG